METELACEDRMQQSVRPEDDITPASQGPACPLSPPPTSSASSALVVHNVASGPVPANSEDKTQDFVCGIPSDSDLAKDQSCLICMDNFTPNRSAYPLPCSNHKAGDVLVHYRCISAWLGGSSTCPLCRGPSEMSILKPKRLLKLDDLSVFAVSPIPLDMGIMRCLVRESKRGILRQLVYEVLLQPENGGLSCSAEDRVVLTARKQLRSPMGSEYILSVPDKFEAGGLRVGRLQSNFLGTRFTFFEESFTQKASSPTSSVKTTQNLPSLSLTGDHSPSRSESSETGSASLPFFREEVGAVTYEANRTSVGPRKMRVCIPEVSEDCVRLSDLPPVASGGGSPTHGGKGSLRRLASRLQQGQGENLMVFKNREPIFRDDVGAYCLDFGGRVSMASVKNFQLIHPEDPSMGNVLQFGRVANNLFTMDFQWPLSPLQALAICLSSCDTKLACV